LGGGGGRKNDGVENEKYVFTNKGGGEKASRMGTRKKGA